MFFSLSARYIEPSQVATYESIQYQDILDDLVTVTDQDALTHAQAVVGDDPSVISTDLSFELFEAVNEIMKNANIQIVGENSSASTELQYLFPIEQEQKQLRSFQEKEQETTHDQQSNTILDELQSEITLSTDSSKNSLRDSVANASITGLSSVLQLEQTNSSTHYDSSVAQLNTPIRLVNNLSSKPSREINLDPLPSLSNSPNSCKNDRSKLDNFEISSSPHHKQLKLTEVITKSSNSCVVSKPMSSLINPTSALKASNNEVILDSGRLDEYNNSEKTKINNADAIQELLRDTTNDQYEVIEDQGKTSRKSHVIVDNVDKLIDQIEQSSANQKRTQLFERTFSCYQQKYHSKLKHQQELLSKKVPKHLLTTPPTKLQLHPICSQQPFKEEKKQKSSPNSSSPKTLGRELIQCSPVKITIPAKLSSPNSLEENVEKKKISKIKQEKSRHRCHLHNCHRYHQHQKNRIISDQLKTENAGLTHCRQPLAQLHHQSSSPTSDRVLSKDEALISFSSHPVQSESQSSTTLHSGFMIDEQTPPSSITSMEHKQSPPLLLLNQARNAKLKTNCSHLLNYNSNNDQQNNNAFITPPPEIDTMPSQQKSISYDNLCQLPNSPHRRKFQRRKSSVTSSTSSKSLTNTDYAIDTQELEPVSPTPLSVPKSKRSQSQSSLSSSNCDDAPLSYFQQEQEKQAKNNHQKKSSSNRSPQLCQHSHPLFNYSYRTSQEPPFIPPMLPQPPPTISIDPYTPTCHHCAPPTVTAPSPFFNFSFPNPFLNPQSTKPIPHFHPHTIKYHHHHHQHPRHHSCHTYSTHPQQYPYHARQQQYNNFNYTRKFTTI